MTSQHTLLADQQRGLQRSIVEGCDAPGLLRAGQGRDPLLQVYRHAYAARLASALRDNFGVLPRVMGDDAFDALAAGYIAAHPSRRPSIRWFGDCLVDFMSTHLALVPHPALVDLARMEWALRAAFDAADGSPLGAEALAGVAPANWPRLRFSPLASVQLLTMNWAIEPVWRAIQSAEPGEEPTLPEPERHVHALLVWRQGLDNRWRILEPVDAELLSAALAGQPFAALCETAAERVGEAQAAQVTATALARWLADGLFEAFVIQQA